MTVTYVWCGRAVRLGNIGEENNVKQETSRKVAYLSERHAIQFIIACIARVVLRGAECWSKRRALLL